jgi:Family of unknown function (DUF6158)
VTSEGIPASQLGDDDLMREMQHLHETRHDAVLHAGVDALETHTRRMLELEAEYTRRDPDREIDPDRLRSGARERAGQPADSGAERDSQSDLHDMGGDIGPASIAGSGDRRDIDEVVRASGGNDEVSSVTPSDETGIDPVDTAGRGADGDTAARAAARHDV